MAHDDEEADEHAALLQRSNDAQRTHVDYASAGFLSPQSPSPDPDPHSYPQAWFDRFLPAIRGRPFSHKLSTNVAAGLTVALINVPLSLSLAVASASTPQAGVLTAVWGGLAAAVFGGSHFNIMGPTGALSGILARYAILWGPESLPLLSLTSGAIMFLAFLFNWDRYVTFLPSSVAHGFTLGVAAIIAGGQLGSAFELPPIPASAEFFTNMSNYLALIARGEGDLRVFCVFAGCWLLLFSLIQRYPKIPWMIPVAALGIFLGFLSTHGVIFRMLTLQDKYGELDLQLFEPPALLHPPTAMQNSWADVLTASLSIAFVGVLESLISGKIADGLTKTSMHQRQETFAVAASNIAAGLTGGLPSTAALARTALNVRSGATSRLAGIFNAFFTLLISIFALPLFGYLPLCVVAALLFQVAVAMIERKHLMHAFAIDRGAFWLTFLVGLLCLMFDPTAAIVFGAVAGLLRFAESVATGYSEVTLTRDYQTGNRLDLSHFDKMHHARMDEGMVISAWRRVFGGGPSAAASQQALLEQQRATPVTLPSASSSDPSDASVIYRLVGDLTYISAMHHTQRIRRLDNGSHLILSFRFCNYLDLDGLDSLEECLAELSARSPTRLILLAGIAPHSIAQSLLQKSAWFQKDFLQRHRVFPTVQDAANFLREHGRGGAGALASPHSGSAGSSWSHALDVGAPASSPSSAMHVTGSPLTGDLPFGSSVLAGGGEVRVSRALSARGSGSRQLSLEGDVT